MIIVNTGNGKGKTTAALGQAMRAVGEGRRVLMIQFIKGPWRSGEDVFISKIKNQKPKTQTKNQKITDDFDFPNFEIIKTGRGFVGILGDMLPIKDHQNAAEEGLALAKREIESGKWDMVILDEINNAVHLNLIPKEKILELIKLANQPTNQPANLILTGRDAPPEFIERADLVTEMKDIKHPFTKGVKAERGLEY